MSLWDWRRMIEDSIPVWVPFALVAVGSVVATVIYWVHDRRKP